MFFSEIIDLGHPLYDGMPCHAASITSFYTVDSFAKTRKMSDGRMGLENKMMLLSEHTGTHLDAPSHFHEGGVSVDQIPLENLLLPGHLLDLTHKRPHDAIEAGRPDRGRGAQWLGRRAGQGGLRPYRTGRQLGHGRLLH